MSSRKEIMQSVTKILDDVTKIQLEDLNDPGVFTVEDYMQEQKITGKGVSRIRGELDLAVKKGKLEKAKKAKLNRVGVVQYVDAYRVPEKPAAKK